MARNIEVATAFFPISVEKSTKSKEDKGWYISGLASTPDVDYQGEEIIPDGIDYKTVFKQNGWITYEHGKDVSDIIGEPVDAYVDDEGFHIKGKLYKNSAKAKEVWDFQNAVEKETESGRTLGFSIEGPVISRDPMNPNVITKMQVKNVTVTYHPANPNARMEVATKSISTEDTATSPISSSALADSISLMSYVVGNSNKDKLLKSAESKLSASGNLNDNALAMILQIGRGVSSQDAMSCINDKE